MISEDKLEKDQRAGLFLILNELIYYGTDPTRDALFGHEYRG